MIDKPLKAAPYALERVKDQAEWWKDQRQNARKKWSKEDTDLLIKFNQSLLRDIASNEKTKQDAKSLDQKLERQNQMTAESLEWYRNYKQHNEYYALSHFSDASERKNKA